MHRLAPNERTEWQSDSERACRDRLRRPTCATEGPRLLRRRAHRIDNRLRPQLCPWQDRFAALGRSEQSERSQDTSAGGETARYVPRRRILVMAPSGRSK